MTKEKDKYNEDSIVSLDDRSHVRLRPAMYVGDTGVFGLHHLVYEVVDNCVDEITNGYGTKINCIIHSDGFVTVEDDGRGIPVGTHKASGKSAAEIVMTSLRSGGKFNNDSYSTAAGLHGIGVSAVNFLSEKLELIISRENFVWSQSYNKGVPVAAFQKGEKTDKTGTIVKFKPDRSIFQTVDFQYKILFDRLHELSYLNKGTRITLKDERTNESAEFYSEGGITALVADADTGKTCYTPVIFFDQEIAVDNKAADKKYKVKIQVAFQYIDAYTDTIFSFANNINTRDGGSHLSGFKSALHDAIVACAEKKKLFKDLPVRPTPRDSMEGLTAVVSVKLPNPELEGQTKSTLGNPEIKVIVYEQVLAALTDYFSKNDGIAEIIAKKVSQACIAREEARKARETVRRKNILSSLSLPGKLADCSEKNPDKCELFIVEGDSAGGSAKMGRNRHFQAVLPIKGKILNVEKAELARILDSEEIKALISAIGYDIQGGDLSRLRYGKIILSCDADVDGEHIKTLLTTLIYRHMKPLLVGGHVYLAQPPLYKIKLGKDDFYIADDEALAEWKEKTKNVDKAIITRFKGLGEMNPEQLSETTMNPITRRLARIIVTDEPETDKIVTILMGHDIDARREYITQNALLVSEEEIDA